MELVNKKIIINCNTGEVIETELTKEELTQQNIDEAAAKVFEEKAKDKAIARQAILDRLGLTEEEARLLLG